MALTSIGDQLTPGRPIEVTFAAETGTPSALQELLLLGHAASGATGINTVVTINNVADLTAASGEVATKFGDGSEIAKMVLAAIRANAGGSTFPNIKCVPLLFGSVDYGTADAALTAAAQVKQEFTVTCYDGADPTLRAKVIAHAQTLSGAQRVENNQYGTVAVFANRSVTDPSLLPKFDSRFGQGVWQRDTSANAYSLGELAAAEAALLAALPVPFNPADKLTINGVPAPAKISDYISVGAGLESESCLSQGWTPLYVKPNGEVGIVRSVTGRRTTNGVTTVTAYFDVQDYQVLYFWRKTVYARLTQPDFTNVKASEAVAKNIKAELIRLASLFEDQGMFQSVKQLASQFVVQRSTSDRHRFDVKTPVNVIPGLHVVATNIEATTQFDTLTV